MTETGETEQRLAALREAAAIAVGLGEIEIAELLLAEAKQILDRRRRSLERDTVSE
jgi:hypothetical protein